MWLELDAINPVIKHKLATWQLRFVLILAVSRSGVSFLSENALHILLALVTSYLS
jgi:hypothetical protein